MISKKTFIHIIELIQEQDKVDEEISAALEKVCGSWVIFNTENKKYSALNVLLREVIDDDFGTIDWWLYENVDKLIYNKKGKVIHDLTKVENLYKYLYKSRQNIVGKGTK